MKKTFHVIIEQDEDGVYVGKVQELQGCLSQGDTLDDLMKNIKEAIELCLEVESDLPEKIEEVAYIDLKELSAIEGFDPDLATELQNRAKTYLEAQERHLTKRIKELKLAEDFALGKVKLLALWSMCQQLFFGHLVLFKVDIVQTNA